MEGVKTRAPTAERLSLRLLRTVVEDLSEEFGTFGVESLDTICQLSSSIHRAAEDARRASSADGADARKGGVLLPCSLKSQQAALPDDLHDDSPKDQQGLLLAFSELDDSSSAKDGGGCREKPSADGQQALLKIFHDLDSDGSGSLSTEELRVALVAAGFPKARAQKMLFAADADGNGLLDFAEWSAAVEDGCEDEEFIRFSESLKRMSLSGEDLTKREVVEERTPPFMLRPDSPIRLAWDLILALMCIYVALVLPFTSGFTHWISPDVVVSVERFELAIDIFFLFDVCLNFRTGIMKQDGTVILDWRRVAISYLSSWFLLDLASSIPFSELSSGSVTSVRALKLMKIPKLLKAVRVLKSLVMVESQMMMIIDETMSTPFLRGLSRRSTMFALTVLLCHWLSCMMAFCSTGWLSAYLAGHNQEERLWSIYLTGIYWGMTTMTTVGWGDLCASTDYERAYAIFAMVVGGAYYGYAVGTVVSMVSNRDLNASAYHERMDAIYAWLDHHKLPADIRRRIIRYFKAYLKEKSAIDEADVVNDLSPALRNEVGSLIIHADILNNPVLDNVPMNAVTRLQNIVNTMYSEEGNVIVHAGESGTAMFIINDGTAKQEFIAEAGRTIQPRTLSAGDSFGEEILCSLMDTYGYTVTVIQKRACLFMIEEEKFKSLFEHMPDVLDQIVKNATKLYNSSVRHATAVKAVTDTN